MTKSKSRRPKPAGYRVLTRVRLCCDTLSKIRRKNPAPGDNGPVALTQKFQAMPGEMISILAVLTRPLGSR